MKLPAQAQLIIAGVAILAAVGLWLRHKFADGTLNPASDQNIANQAANSIWQGVTGDENATIGGSIYDWTHSDDAGDLSTLVMLFERQGVNDSTLATARRLGWTEADISRARSMIGFVAPN